MPDKQQTGPTIPRHRTEPVISTQAQNKVSEMTDLYFSEYRARQDWMQNAALSDLTHHAQNIAFNARQIISTPYRLQYQESFQTRMETAMQEAIDASRLAIEALEKQLADYRKLRVKNAA